MASPLTTCIVLAFILAGAPCGCVRSQDAQRQPASSVLRTSAAADSIAPATTSSVAPPTRPALIAELTFGNDSAGQSPVRYPVVRVYADGRVEFSRDLVRGGGPMHEGQLSAAELQRFSRAITHIASGIGPGRTRYKVSTSPYHRVVLTPPGQPATVLETSVRFIETETGVMQGGLWYADGGAKYATRFEALQAAEPPGKLAFRHVFAELEAEMVRAAASSMLPEPVFGSSDLPPRGHQGSWHLLRPRPGTEPATRPSGG